MMKEVDAFVDRHFPGSKHPPLLEIEKNAALGLHFGHPLIMDGQRPIAPNYIYVGMMLCRDAKPIENADIKAFMDSAGPEGVVVVSFG